MNKRFLFSIVVLLAVLLASCAPAATATKAPAASQPETSKATELKWPTPDKLFVCFSQADLKSTWRTVENDDMKAGAEKRGYKFATTNAESDTEKQL
jgi:simple sugar transport system substrate-binding protein/ribose transport system substrate-binding protein